MSSEVLQSLARHFLTAFAGWLVAQGYVSESDQQTIIGLGLALVALGWSIWNKHKAQLAIATAQGQPPAQSGAVKSLALAMIAVPVLAGLVGCTAAQTAAVNGFEATALSGIQNAEDHNIGVWKTDACGTPFSAVVRNSQTIPGLVPALSALCVPNADKGNPADLLNKAATP